MIIKIKEFFKANPFLILVFALILACIFLFIKTNYKPHYMVDYSFNSEQKTITFTADKNHTFNHYEMRFNNVLQAVSDSDNTYKIIGTGTEFIDFYIADRKGNITQYHFQFVANDDGFNSIYRLDDFDNIIDSDQVF